MIIEGELKDYIVIPIEDLISIRNELKTENSLIMKNYYTQYIEYPGIMVERNTGKIELIADLLEKYK